MTKTKLKVCIIGCGMIANSAHIPAYKSMPDEYELTAVYDMSESAAEDTAKKHDIPYFYNNAEKMLTEQRPDVVSVCTPNIYHKEYVMLALQYGANVLCEKPLELSYKSAKEMFVYAEDQGKILMTCQSLRFLPERLKAMEMVKNGELGDVYYAEMSRVRRRGIPTWGKFHIKEYNGGGALVDIGVHGIDSAVWLMGNPKPVSVFADMKKIHTDEFGTLQSAGALKGYDVKNKFNPDEMNVESFSNGMVKFENGAVLNFKAAWAANLREENNIILAGRYCGIDLENRKIYSGSENESVLQVNPNGFKNEPFYGHFCLTKNLARVLRGESEPFVKSSETLNTAVIIEAAYISAAENREVKTEEITND